MNDIFQHPSERTSIGGPTMGGPLSLGTVFKVGYYRLVSWHVLARRWGGGGEDTYKYYNRNKYSQPIRPILEWGVGGWVDGRYGRSIFWMDGWMDGMLDH